MDTLKRVSGFWFYLLGAVLIILIVLSHRAMLPAKAVPFMNLFDLPILFAGSLYGGSSLYLSLVHEKKSIGLLIIIFLPLIVLFGFLAYLKFALPFAVFEF